MKTPFLKPRLVGTRFEEHSLPVDVLKDWAAFEDLVVEVAKHLYLQDNEGRKRTPRGFADDFSLHLSGVEEGSAVPVLDRISRKNLPLGGDYFDKALDLVKSVVLAASQGQPLPEGFPVHLLGYFDHFGRSLREDEHIEWTATDTNQLVRYDRETRKRLVLTGSKTYQSASDLRGWITEVNAEKGTYTIKLIAGPKLVGKYPPELAAEVLDCLREFQSGKYQSAKVFVRGVADFDGNDQPIQVAETQHIEMLDPNDVPARCEELSLLRQGWLDGHGQPPDPVGMKWFRDAWAALDRDALPLPFIYPTEDGGIQLEWTLGELAVSAEVDLKERKAEVCVVNLSTKASREAAVDLSAPTGWETLAALVNDPESEPA